MSKRRPDDESLEAIRERGRRARQEMKETIERVRARQVEYEKLLRRNAGQLPLIVAATERELAHVRQFDTFCCGIGPVEAALQTATRLTRGGPDAVIHIGLAGARSLEPPALVLGSESVYEDARGPLVPARVVPDADLLARVRAALPDAHVLPIGTSAHVGGTSACEVEAMEGFAVLRACALAGVPAVELRAVSNAIDEADRSKWRFDDALAALADALERLDVL